MYFWRLNKVFVIIIVIIIINIDIPLALQREGTKRDVFSFSNSWSEVDLGARA